MSIKKFSQMGVRGLRDHKTVRKYWNAWDKAIKDGLFPPSVVM